MPPPASEPPERATAAAPADEYRQREIEVAFFLNDTKTRLNRLVSLAVTHALFMVLLYCRILCPGGKELWVWLQPRACWPIVFAPLFAMDYLSYKHVKYLRANVELSPPRAALLQLVAVSCEMAAKALLCLSLMMEPVGRAIGPGLSVTPVIAGYVFQFLLAHLLPNPQLQERDRPEGCGALAALVSESVRLFVLALLLSLALKAEGVTAKTYSWQGAFWPCFGLVGMVVLLIVFSLPALLVSVIVQDRGRMIMLFWILITAVGMGAATLFTMIGVSKVLQDESFPCGDLAKDVEPRNGGAGHDVELCRHYLEIAFVPWIVVLPCFALLTLQCREKLATTLHTVWYYSPRNRVEIARRARLPTEILPAPEVMFKIAATFYTREPAMDEDGESSAPSSLGGAVGALAGLAAASGRLGGTPKRSLMASGASSAAPMSLASVARSETSDVAGTIISARGGAYQDIVEDENLCFVCYSDPPDSILLECGHAGLCCDCATRLLEGDLERAKCPICRAQVAQVAQILDKKPLPAALFRRGSSAVLRALAPSDAAGATAATALLGSGAREPRSANFTPRGAATPVGSVAATSAPSSKHGSVVEVDRGSGVSSEAGAAAVPLERGSGNATPSPRSSASGKPPMNTFPSISSSASFKRLTSSASAAGPPWPAWTKQSAVCVEVIKKQMVQQPVEVSEDV